MTTNGEVPKLKPGILLLPQPTSGEKWGIDDYAANRDWEISDFNSFIYPMHEVFDEAGKFVAYERGLLSPPPNPVSENGDNKNLDLLPVLTVAEFLEEAPESYDWVAQDIVAKGAVTKFAGRAKEAGKTTFLMNMVADVLNGTPFLNLPTKKSRVLFMSEQAANLREALKDAGIDDPEVKGLFLLPAHLVSHLSWRELMRMVRTYCVEREIDLLVIDTLVDFSDVEDTEENSSGKVKGTIKPLKNLAHSHKVAVVFTQHHNLENRGRGSTQFDAEPDIIVDLFAPDQVSGDLDRNMRQLQAKGRGVDYRKLVKFTPEDGYELCGAADETMSEIPRSAKTILRFLPVLEADARTVDALVEVLKEAGKSMGRTTVDRGVNNLVEEGLANRKGEGLKGDPKRFWREDLARTKTKEQNNIDIPVPNLLSPLSETGDGSGDNKNDPALNVVPIRPGVSLDADTGKASHTNYLPEELAAKFPGYVHTEQRLQECQHAISECSEVSLDIETQGKNRNEALLYTKATIRGVTVHADGETWFLDCDHLDDNSVAALLKLLEDKPKYLHNAVFDVPRIHRRFGVLLSKNVHDTVIASRAARAGEWEEVQKNNKVTRPPIEHKLEACLKRELAVDVPGGFGDGKKWLGSLTEKHMTYISDDVRYLKELYGKLLERMDALGTREAYNAIAETVHVFLEAAANGIPFDASTLAAIQDEIARERDAYESVLQEHAPPHPEAEGEWKWRNSSKPDAVDDHGNKVGRNGALRMLEVAGVKLPNLEEQTLLDNIDKHPLVKALYDYRTAANRYSKYARILTDFYENGRLYPQVKIAGADTGRVLYSDPNIQGFDKKKTNRYRKCVRAEEGYAIVKGDYAQQELRIAAYFSKDVDLLSAFANGEDVYMRVAEKIVGKPIQRGSTEGEAARSAAKRAVLGYLYGLGPAKYRRNAYKDTGVEITEADAERDRDAFREAYSGFYKWQNEYGPYKDETNLPKPDRWETRSVRGWRRVVEGQNEKKSAWGNKKDAPAKWVPKYTERLNGPIQSTAGDILYLTLQKIDADLAADCYPGTRFLFTAHDEIVLTCPEGVAGEVAQWLKDKMVEGIEEVLGKDLGGPKSVEVGTGPSWGETEEV